MCLIEFIGNNAFKQPDLTPVFIQVDGFVGSHLIHEDSSQRVWNFTLEPGQMTSMHTHDFDYTFTVMRPSQVLPFLPVY